MPSSLYVKQLDSIVYNVVVMVLVIAYLVQRVLASSSDFASCSQSSSLLISLRCDVTLDKSETTFWSSDPSIDTQSAWLLFSYPATREVGSYMIQSIKSGFSQQSPSRWRLYAGLTLNDLRLVEERNVAGWRGLEQRVFVLASAVKLVHMKLEFLAVEFPVFGQNQVYSLTAFAAYPPVVLTFFTSDWSECSEPCDGGSQSRNVACWGNDGRRDYPIVDCEFSLGPAPENIQVCNTQPCLVPEITEVRAKAVGSRTDQLTVTCFPNSATDAKCITLLAIEERFPSYAEVTDFAVIGHPCAPPNCSFNVDGLTGNTAYLVYCAVPDVFEVDLQSVVGLMQPVFTSAANVTAVVVLDAAESSLTVSVSLKEIMTAGVDISCTAVHLGYTLYPSAYKYLSSDIQSQTLPTRPDVTVQLQRCVIVTCVLSFREILASGANYRVDCKSQAGRVVSSATVSTVTASIQGIQYLSATMDPKITARIFLSSASHVSCSLTPVKTLVCCPNAPQFVDFKLLPTIPCGPDCVITFSGLKNSTRYAVWCSAAPFTDSTFYLFPNDDSGFRFDTPEESSGITVATTTPPPPDLGPVRHSDAVEGVLAGSNVVQSAVIGAIISVGFIVLSCAFTRTGRILYGLNPTGHGGPALPPSGHKLVALDVTVLVSAVVNIVVLIQGKQLSETLASSAVGFFLGSSICLWVYQTLVLGIFQLLISREKLSMDTMDFHVLSMLHLPFVSLTAVSFAGDAELEQAWATKATLLRRETLLVTCPSLVALAVRGLHGVFGVLAIVAMVCKLIMCLVTFTEAVIIEDYEEVHTEQIQVIANKRDYGPDT